MLGYKKGNTKQLAGQIPLHYPADRTYLDGDPTKNVQDKCARKADLTNLDLTGTTNTTGSTIASGTYFYLNGTLVRAKTDIANGATFTNNTNYEVVTAGGLNTIQANHTFLENGVTVEKALAWENVGFHHSTSQTEITSFDPAKRKELMIVVADANLRVFGTTIIPMAVAINGQSHVMQYQSIATAYFVFSNNKPYAWSSNASYYVAIYIR